MSLDMDDPRSPYVQVANAIRGEIRSGRLAPGDRLPTVAELAEQYGVAKMTVQKAIGQLRDEGLVMSWQGRGTFVREPRGDVAAIAAGAYDTVMERLDSIHDELQNLEQRVAELEKPPATKRERRRDG